MCLCPVVTYFIPSRDICSLHGININSLIDALKKCERKIVTADRLDAQGVDT